MFLFFKTTVDFNVLRSPDGWWSSQLIGDEYGVRICPFGRVAIFALIFILIARHYIKIPQDFINISLVVAFFLSLSRTDKSNLSSLNSDLSKTKRTFISFRSKE